MKRIRLIASVIFVVMLCCLLAVGASAKWWDENPFTDVKSSSWYYDAVRICNENGLFEGTSETTFGTSGEMSRSMLVTVLAAGDESFDENAYTKSSFDDVRDGSWYMAAVEWANEKGIASGIADGAFGPKNPVSRQELALMLRKYAEYKGMDTSVAESTDISGYPDSANVSGWATEAVKWAVENELISGTAQGDKVLLSPKGNATRATVAQIMVKFLALDPVREINGNDISLYTIVYGASEIESVEDAANVLRRYIEESLGVKLPVVSDESEVSDHEILVGHTNREDMGLVKVDREAFADDQNVSWSVQGSYLVICGIDGDHHDDDGSRTARNVDGSYNAVFYFAEEELGAQVYSLSSGRGMENGIIRYEPSPVISLDDGYSVILDGPWFKERIFYMSGGILGSGEYEKTLGCNITQWITGEYGNDEYQYADTPCMSNEENIAAIIANIKKRLAENPTASRVELGINDSDGYCKCTMCMDNYRDYGGRSATLALLANRVSDAIVEEYPNVTIRLGAYTYVIAPPENLELRSNISVRYITVRHCSGHEYSDTSCKINSKLPAEIERWGELARELHIWDHCGAFIYMMTPYPDWDSMLSNMRYFAENGARQVLMNSVLNRGDTYSDFGYLRASLYSRIYLDPFMREDEFEYLKNKTFEAYYGSGWRSIREYTDIIAELGNSMHHSNHAATVGFYNYDEVETRVDYIDALWADALSKAQGEELVRLELAHTSWLYLRQCAVYEKRYENGTEDQRQKYRKINQDLYDYVSEYGVCWTENILTGDMNPINNFSPSNSPEKW